MAYEPKITRKRFAVSVFSPEEMLTVGNVVRDSIADRITSGINAFDGPAMPLKHAANGKRGYPDRKIAKGLRPIRDWTWRGKTIRSMKVKRASENKVVIGFTDPESDMVAAINNRREKAFGISPNDKKALVEIVKAIAKEARIIRVQSA